MEIVRDKALRPLKQLRRSLRQAELEPDEEQVHGLRTRMRRVEAVLTALRLNGKKPARKLLKRIKPLHKAAGRVRDLDVLLGCVLGLAQSGASESALRLAAHLTRVRGLCAQDLSMALISQSKPVRKSLKRGLRLLKRQFAQAAPSLEGANEALAMELAAWPPLEAANLHEFRIRAKVLLYTLNLCKLPEQRLLRRLGAAKDAIGAWHDWDELANQAALVLDPEEDRALLDGIDQQVARELAKALKVGQELRRELAGRVIG